jgi:hypothetical protein
MFSHRFVAPAFVRIILVVGAIALTACADALTSPTQSPRAARAVRDGNPDDTLACKSGWVINTGLYSCTQ